MGRGFSESESVVERDQIEGTYSTIFIYPEPRINTIAVEITHPNLDQKTFKEINKKWEEEGVVVKRFPSNPKRVCREWQEEERGNMRPVEL